MTPIRTSRVRSLSVAIAVIGGVAIAGCGSAGGPSGTSTNAMSTSAVGFSRCMRTHGVPSFPDPGPGGYTRSGVNLRSPAVQSAMNECRRYLPETGHSPSVPARVRHQELLLASCMRTNGVPNFPDPNANGDIQFPVDSPIPQSPAFRRAQNGPCKKYLSP